MPGKLSDRRLSVIVFSLLFAWLLAFPFEGRVLYALSDHYGVSAERYVVGIVAAQFAGLLLGGLGVRTIQAAKRVLVSSSLYCIFSSALFFFPPTVAWTAALFSGSLVSGCAVAAWGFFVRQGTPSSERIKTVADGLIYSNILMILLNVVAVRFSAHAGLGLSILSLCLAFWFSYSHLALTSWYWAIPLASQPPRERAMLISSVSPVDRGKLTERESEIAGFLLTGKTYRAIAELLHVSENTVKTHIKNIYWKAGVRSRAELMSMMIDKRTP